MEKIGHSSHPVINNQYSAQQVINDYVNPNRAKNQVKNIEDKFSYESLTDGKYKYKLTSQDSKDDLFIGTLAENGNQCVIRSYDTSVAKYYMRDLEALQTKKKNLHENFIRYFGKVEVGTQTYYAFELCQYSVEELIRNPTTDILYENIWKVLTLEKIMHQTALGLDYLHGLEGGFIHRNIHGRNVLVAEIASGSNTHYAVKLSDFRFGKPAQKEVQNSLTKSSSGWIAPEMNDPEAMLGPWTDVFILGCFFYYVLSGGHHPFGRNDDKPNREKNITDGIYASGCWDVASDVKKLPTVKFTDLIKDMTKRSAGDRTSLSRVLQFFQNDSGYFPLYPPNVDQGVKPGLCAIVNQIEFPKIPSGREQTVRDLCKNLISSCTGQQMLVDSMATTKLLYDVEALADNYLQYSQLSPNVRKSFETFLLGYFPGDDPRSFCQSADTALIQKVKKIVNHLKPEIRHGSVKDEDALSHTFTGFGYDKRHYYNLTAEQLRTNLKNLAQEKNSNGQSIFKGYASLVVCILSHGSLGTVLGVDGKPVNVLELQYEAFNSETCPDLNDKPKIFIIQACQGGIGQRMILTDPTNDDLVRINSSPALNSKLNIAPAALEGDQPIVTTSTDKIKSQFRDVITLWSTIEGFVSLRDSTTGSVFIQSLCKQLKDFGGRNSRDLYEAHLDVTQEITDHHHQVTFPFQINGQRVSRQYLINQTPLFKSTAYRKVAFQTSV